ncbi:hypothetical protein BIW11_08002, partial [Tropilaelaps mercedesae]
CSSGSSSSLCDDEAQRENQGGRQEVIFTLTASQKNGGSMSESGKQMQTQSLGAGVGEKDFRLSDLSVIKTIGGTKTMTFLFFVFSCSPKRPFQHESVTKPDLPIYKLPLSLVFPKCTPTSSVTSHICTQQDSDAETSRRTASATFRAHSSAEVDSALPFKLPSGKLKIGTHLMQASGSEVPVKNG